MKAYCATLSEWLGAKRRAAQPDFRGRGHRRRRV